MRIFGLIGYPLGHSFSKKYFTEKFARESVNDCIYENFSMQEIGQIETLLKNNPDICGLNVTIPYKTEVIRYLDEIADDAMELGAVNVIKVTQKDGKKFLKGFNSDIFGFRESIAPFIRDDADNALILGTGGSSKAVAYVLLHMGINFIHVSREKKKGCITYEDLTRELIENHQIIINTTPAGMFPDTLGYPKIPYMYLNNRHLLYDLVYNPEMTEFLKRGKERKCSVIGGLKMLHLQAERSWEIWNDTTV